jgi:DNA-binding response OmpR family regulator
LYLKKTILCIDNNADSCDLISFIFQKAGYEVITCSLPEEGIRLARTKDFVAIVSEFGLGGMDGTDLCRIIRTFDTEIPIIFYTGEARLAKKQAALEAGAQAYLIKPADITLITDTVLNHIEQKSELF